MKFYHKGKHHEPADYHTDDLNDAHSTAKHGLSRASGGGNVEILREDNINELSKRTLGSYVRKASQEVGYHDHKTGYEYLAGRKSMADLHADLAAKRDKQVTKALGKLTKGSVDEAKMPLPGHHYHYKSNDELNYIRHDAHAAAEAMRDHSPEAENKYRDQVNDAETILGHRKRTGATPEPRPRITEGTLDEVAPPGRESQVKALKKKVGEKSAFKIAWSAYRKKNPDYKPKTG